MKLASVSEQSLVALLVDLAAGLHGAGTSLHIYRQMSSQTVVVVVLGSTVAKVAKKAQLLISALHILTRVAKVTKTTVTVY